MKVNNGTSSAGNLEISLHFMGANSGVVTGSATIVIVRRYDKVRYILVDYGLFQGKNEVMNIDRVIESDKIDCVLITHSHSDHCGSIPMLFSILNSQNKFTGKIYGSRETLAQSIPLLRDSAAQYEHTYKFLKRDFEKTNISLQKEKERAERNEANPHDIAALDSAISSIMDQYDIIPFTRDDVDEAIKHYVPVDVSREGTEITLFEGIYAKFIPTSHMNGSTMIEIRVTTDEEEKTVVFTGDIGRDNSLLYRRMDYPVNPKANAIVVESLNGSNAPSETTEESISALRQILKKAKKDKDTVILPCFSQDRQPLMVKLCNDFMDDGMKLQCFIDSPLAMRELDIYKNSYLNHSTWFSYSSGYPFKLERFRVIKDYSEHCMLTKYRGPNVIMTSFGMGKSKRFLDYFEEHIEEEKTIFVFPCYIEENSIAKLLIDTKIGDEIEINNRKYTKRCRAIQLYGFSSHGYMEEKLRILKSYPNLKTVFFNHGDLESLYDTMAGVRDALYDDESREMVPDIIVPEYDSVYTIP